MNNFNSNFLKQLQGSRGTIGLRVVNFFDIAEINKTLRAGRAREMRDKRKLIDKTWAVTIDHGIFFGMEAAAVPCFVPVAAIG